ncbi:MAG: undecaprenyldiphospho-muramoylpentapeptide beta-N-acetylglucosaminyltransferase [Mangrovibacterium sp.]
MSSLKVIISGGGTGGHIFPALSVAEALREKIPGADIRFVGALGRMEMERVPAAGFPIVGLPVTGMPRKLSFGIVRFVWKLVLSMYRAHRLIAVFKPDVAVGVGGFASGPVLRAAVRRGIPAVLQEQNSCAGLTNRLLARRVRSICVAYPHMDRYFPAEKIILTGNPVRRTLLNRPDRLLALKSFALDPGKPVALILGGSLGARSLNESVLAGLEHIRQSEIQLIWQTGSLYYREMIDRLQNNGPVGLKPVEFVSDMQLAYRAADLVISRAGAGTISELCLLGKPAILVPSPNVAEDHQTRNALSLVEQDAAVMVRDTEVREKLLPEIRNLLADKTRMERLAKNSLKLGRPEATDKIVEVILREAGYPCRQKG